MGNKFKINNNNFQRDLKEFKKKQKYKKNN